MDLRDQIDEYLAVKKYSSSTVKSHRSILYDFNIWQMHRPAMKMAEKAVGYDQYIRENCFRKPGTADKQIGVVRRFCSWLEETGRVAAFRLDEQLLGRPEMRRVPDAPVSPDDLIRMLNVVSRHPGANSLRDAAMTALAVTCGLTSSEISSLNVCDVTGFGSGDEMILYKRTLPLPRVTALLVKWYARGRTVRYGREPLFATSADGEDRMDKDEIRRRISTILELVGCKYEDAVPGDAQLRIAQHFRNLDEPARRAAAMVVQGMAYDTQKMPSNFVRDLRERFVEARICERPCEPDTYLNRVR